MKIEHLYISPAHIYFGHHGREPGPEPMIECEEIECLAGRGIRGDRFCDFKASYKGQITFFAAEVYEQLCQSRPEVERTPDVFRRNVIVRGVDLNTLIGQEFELQGIRFGGTQECSPCDWMDLAFGPGTEAFLQNRGGLRARILSGGVLRRDG